MLRLKMLGEVRTGRARKTNAVLGVLAAGFLMAGSAVLWAQGTVAPGTQQQQAPIPIAGSKIALAAPVTYDNKFDFYGAFNFMNFMAGQNLPKRMNMGGAEVSLTYWLPVKNWARNLGPTADFRYDAGTTPVFANGGTTPPSMYGTGVNNRPLVSLYTGMLGAQYRGPKNQYAALNFHGYFGASAGIFNYSLNHVTPGDESEIGLYTNRIKPMAALGGSVDFNVKKNWAIRFSPDLILEHFGTETREFVGVSGGVIYRIGKKK
jgi:hypothetical protein